MVVCGVLLLSCAMSGQGGVAGVRQETPKSAEGWGPVEDAEKADVLVEVQRVPPMGVLPEKDWTKLNPPELCQVWLVRMSNDGQFPSAFTKKAGSAGPEPASFWLEGNETATGLPAIGAGCKSQIVDRFLGERLRGADGRERQELRNELWQGIRRYWAGVLLPVPLDGDENTRALSRTLSDGNELAWLRNVINTGPHTAIPANIGSSRPPPAEYAQCSVLWPGSSVWGYVLFQLSASTGTAELRCDLGKAVTWHVIEKHDLAQAIMDEQANGR